MVIKAAEPPVIVYLKRVRVLALSFSPSIVVVAPSIVVVVVFGGKNVL